MSDLATSARAQAAQELLRGAALAQSGAAEAAPRGEAGGKSGRRRNKDAGDEDKPKGSKKKLIILMVVLLLVAFEAKGKVMKPHYGPHVKVPAGQIYALGSTTITTNLSDGHLAEVGISLQLTKPANMKLINDDLPKLTNSTIQILSGETYDELLGPPGRAELASDLLAAYQHDLGLSEGAQQVTGVYFTDFVLQ